ncbi:CotH kinase family protein [Fusibacter ferrireducens]|uniref:CotH kinase family protein n=1 Tax=Fusibacter ferrireducens TaxID=2785058 RepID=A0ABR9ZUQ5_9FIRM|nr:CotH kinase family protein [Fusibacter ferrireducens]MBF4694199.1 CotH kinase family protein [Fusibacter ferrireducens]
MKRSININTILIAIIFILILFLGYSMYQAYLDVDERVETHYEYPYAEPVIESSIQIPIVDNESVYSNDKDGEVIDVYVTILQPDSDKYSTHDDLLAYKFAYDSVNKKPAAKAVFQIGDENGPKQGILSMSPKVANAILEPRGRSTSRSPYKSYKITLSDKAALWGGQKVLNLNYHPYDKSRVRNKLSFDFYEILPNVASLRTQFVRLHIKDNSKGTEGEFVDYGLFTHVEQVNKRYLSAHGLDREGQLYKANSFEFHRYFDTLKLKTDTDYDQEKFDERLEIRGSDDHSKLLNMLNDLNNNAIDIDEVIEKHFNRENYLTWLASNIIIGNNDTVSQNFFLYSPQAIENWYFIPWDCDGAWGWIDEHSLEDRNSLYSEWQFGIQNLWGSKLNNRFLRKKENVVQLDQKIDELIRFYNEDQINHFLSTYYPEVLKSQSKPEALMRMNSSPEAFAKAYNLIPSIPQKNYETYEASKQKPMPFFQNPVEMRDGEAYFSWGNSFDLQNDQLVYDLEVSTTPDMMNIVYSALGLNETEAFLKLEKGTYYMRTKVRDTSGNSMIAFDTYTDLEDVSYFGVLEVQVD